MMTFPETVWSEKHARTLDAAASVAFLPMSFVAMPSNVAHAEPAKPTATSSSSEGSATTRWNAAIDEKVKPGTTRQQAAVMVAKENPTLQQAYIEEFRRQAAQR